MDRAIHLSCRAYGLLLLLYPYDFRREFAAEMPAEFAVRVNSRRPSLVKVARSM